MGYRDFGEFTIYVDEEGREFVSRDFGSAEQEAAFRRERAKMPKEFENVTGKDFLWQCYQANIDSERRLINQFITKYRLYDEKGMGLYIYSGTKGSGKTMLSCCIINEIVKRYRFPVKFINALDLLELTKNGYGRNDNDREEIRSLYAAKILVIDDIGSQMAREWTNTVFYRLINTRYNNRQVTIYTSNMRAADLNMDERITERIDSTTFPVMLPEVNVRARIREEERRRIAAEIENAPT